MAKIHTEESKDDLTHEVFCNKLFQKKLRKTVTVFFLAYFQDPFDAKANQHFQNKKFPKTSKNDFNV